jgi:uroporphyrinogen decarboxylase
VLEGGGWVDNRERVLASLSHRQPDKVPYDVRFTQKAHAQMVEFYGDPHFASKLGNCLTWLSCEPAESRKEVGPDIWEDQFGVRWDRSIDKDIGNVCNQQVTRENLRDYRFPDPSDPSRYAYTEKVLEQKGDRFALVNFGFSLFERAWTLFGMENLLLAMVDDPQFAHQLLDGILEFNLEVIERACSFDIDAMIFGDDCGVDVFNPFQPEVMDVFEIKKEYGSELSFYGGVSVQKTLPCGTVSEVREETKRLLDVVGRDGGYIAAPSHWIPADSKPENIAALIEILQSQ